MHRFIALMLPLMLVTGCDQTPSGRDQLALMPDTMMADFGRQTFVQMQQQTPVNHKQADNRKVQCVARHLLAHVENRFPGTPLPPSWEIVVFADPSPNAFALPGGKIGVHEGLLDVATSDDQLAAVIGHELAHVLARHGNERLTQQLGIRTVLVVVGMLSEGDEDSQAIIQALGLGAHLGLALPFSRTHEQEADLMGLELMASAGFDPRESVQLWQNMAAAKGGQPVEFLSTHPNPGSRIAALEGKMQVALQLYQQATPVNCDP